MSAREHATLAAGAADLKRNQPGITGGKALAPVGGPPPGAITHAPVWRLARRGGRGRRAAALFVVGNKADQDSARQVSAAEGLAYAKEIKAEFSEVSAKDNTGGRIAHALVEAAAQAHDDAALAFASGSARCRQGSTSSFWRSGAR